MSDNGTAFYLYCLANPGLAAGIVEGAGQESASPLPAFGRGGMLGIDGRNMVFVRPFPAACAVLSEVATEELCGPLAVNQLNDIAWVGPRACRHEEVVEKVMAVSPVLPAPFATLFSSLCQLQDFMEGQARTISQFLNFVADKEEWGVRGLADMAKLRQTAIVHESSARGAQLASLSPGSRYLQERRIQIAAEKSVHGRVSEFCQELAKELQQHTTAFTERQLWDSGQELKSVSNWAFLLPKTQVAAFQSHLESANDRFQQVGLSFKLSGPWPPYSFAPNLATGLPET